MAFLLLFKYLSKIHDVKLFHGCQILDVVWCAMGVFDQPVNSVDRLAKVCFMVNRCHEILAKKTWNLVFDIACFGCTCSATVFNHVSGSIVFIRNGGLYVEPAIDIVGLIEIQAVGCFKHFFHLPINIMVFRGVNVLVRRQNR